jgi:IclR family KDG regulon transcriptional repressor
VPKSISPAILTGLSILEYMAATPELGVTELARKLNAGKSSVHRILNTLAHKDYIEKNPATGRYRLTYRLFLVASTAADRFGLKEVAAPMMERLAMATGETVNLGILEEDRVVNLHKVSGPQPIRLHIHAPGGVKAHATGLGKVLLAGLEPKELDNRLGTSRLARLTPNTHATRRSLHAELERVRRRGYAIDNEECSAGIRAVAVPIRDSRGTIVAALSIAGPTHRLTEKRIADLAPNLLATGEEISRRLGYDRADPGERRSGREAPSIRQSTRAPGPRTGGDVEPKEF